MPKKFLLIFLILLPWTIYCEVLCCEDTPPAYSLKPSDKFQFGRLWTQIKRLENEGLLYEMIEKRRREIASIKNHWKAKIPSIEKAAFLVYLQEILQKGILIPSQNGCGAAYFLCDKTGAPQYVVKPFDEDILCLNNRKHFSCPYNDHAFRVRDHIPLYRSAQAETLSYAIASILGFSNLTPTTHLAIITHENFFDITDHLDNASSIIEQMGPPDREKLCSVQPYLSGLQNLYELVEELLKKNFSEEEICATMDLEDFENLTILIWLLYDTDAHAGNLYVKKDPRGIYRFIKVDNGLTFPNRNSHLLNALSFFPQAKRPLSQRAHNLLKTLPIEQMAEKIRLFEMENALDAFYERVETLQELIKTPKISIREIDLRLHALELPKGREVALSNLSAKELQKLLAYPGLN